MKFSDGLFLRGRPRRWPRDYPDIAFEDRIIDALCMQLIQAPERFDVLVMPNLYGDVAAELGAGLIGGSAWRPGAHFGGRGRLELGGVRGHPRHRARDLAGTNTADPIGVMLSGAMLLRHVGEARRATAWRPRWPGCSPTARTCPRDLRAPDDDRPGAGTFQFADAVIAAL